MKILGIDIGGSAVKAAIVETRTGKLVTDRLRIKTSQPSKPGEVAGIFAEVTQHFNWSGKIGCGFPAVIQKGIAQTASNIDKSWIGTNLVELFREASKCPVDVINDADAAGLAEMRFGAGRGNNGVVVLITVGTGLGSALFTRRKLFPNTEFGHFYLHGHIAEKYAADSVRKNENLSWKKWAKRFNKYLKHLEMLLSPDLFIIGGGASKKYEKFFPHITVRANVVAAQLGNEAGIVGAALIGEKIKLPLPASSEKDRAK